MGKINFYNTDCMLFMKDKPDNYYDLAIVDPPYGIGEFTQSETKKYGKYDWNKSVPTNDYFIELKRVSKNRIIWGANYYNCFEGGNAAIVWNKENPHPSLSDCEIASVSWGKRIAYYKYQWHGLGMHKKRSGFHPCEKPIDLYRWILQNYAKSGYKLLDTHGGSMSSAIAADLEGYEMDITEIDKEYFDAGVQRYEWYKRQLKLF